ncbi:MAG TPA: FAD:protein FMN transferase [Spirochaetota bacterium]|nr:FAD:protein FMN transferase [Spirochaetota bacterium]HPP05370.1 FAD:protein FMN transferase [Spirochaetota bacterium]
MLNNRIIVILIFSLLLISCNSEEYKKYSKNAYVMGTTLEIILFSNNKNIAEKIIEEAIILARELEKKSSCKIEDSIISILNKKKEMIIEDEFIFDLLERSYYFATITDGAFDPSLYNLIKLWGFEDDKNRVPKKDEIKESLLKSGYKNIFIDKNSKKISLKNETSLDLGAIAKGRIVDEISNFIKKNGITDFIVNAGGDLFVSGLFNGKRKWKIAIADPFNKNDVIGLIEISDMAIVTSGDYERFFVDNGNIYHHILDPVTGYPVNNGLHSITLIADNTTKADALATALFVMGEEKALNFVNKDKNLFLILISGTRDNPKINFSSNISGFKDSTNRWQFSIR